MALTANTTVTASKENLPEGFDATPMAQALIAKANAGSEVSIDDAIDVIVEYGQMRQRAFESDVQVEFLHKHPTFMSIPAVRAVGRSPEFTKVFEKLVGTKEEVDHFRNTVVAELVARGDMQPSAEEVVAEAIALALAVAAHAETYDAELAALSKYETVPSTKDVIASLTTN